MTYNNQLKTKTRQIQKQENGLKPLRKTDRDLEKAVKRKALIGDHWKLLKE